MLSGGHHAVGKSGHKATGHVVNRQVDVTGHGQLEADRGTGIEGVRVGRQLEVSGLLLGRHIDTRAVSGTVGANLLIPVVVLRQVR